MNAQRDSSAVIVGAGPAGSVAALTLARTSAKVLLLERRHSFDARAGETLPPVASSLVRRFGLWQDFLATELVESPGNLSLWGSNEPGGTDFIFSPYGCGWHLDRAAFDAMLVQAAVASGAKPHSGACVLGAKWHGSQWLVSYRDRNGVHQTQASWLIVATGRAGRSLVPPIQRIQTDRLFACFPLTSAQDSEDVRTWLEAAPDGWWYSAPVPGRKLALAYFTDADLLPKSADARRVWLAESIARTVLMRRHVPSPLTDRQVVNARSGYQETPVRTQLLFVGDAALSAEIIGASANESYTDWLTRFREDYFKDYNWFYGKEQRWPSSIF